MQSLGLLGLVFEPGLSGVFPLTGHLCRLTSRCGCFSVHRTVGWSGSENWLMGIQQSGLEFSLGFTVQIQLAKTPLKLEKCWSYWWILVNSFFPGISLWWIWLAIINLFVLIFRSTGNSWNLNVGAQWSICESWESRLLWRVIIESIRHFFLGMNWTYTARLGPSLF